MAVDYGTDISCLQDLDPYFALVSGPEAVAQALARRLLTPSGGLLTDPSYGYDLRALVLTDLSEEERLSAENEISAQAIQDERISDAVVQISLNSSTGVLTVSVQPLLVTGEIFTLVFTLTPENTELVFQNAVWGGGSV